MGRRPERENGLHSNLLPAAGGRTPRFIAGADGEQMLAICRQHGSLDNLLRNVNSMVRVASLASACWAAPQSLALAVAQANRSTGQVLPVSDERARWR